LCTYGWAQIYDGDIGHHLKAGEWMTAHGEILKRDIFSYTAYGNPWLNHSWLAQIILYGIYCLGGIDGLIFFKIIILFISYVFLVKACHHMVFFSSEEGRQEEGIIYNAIIGILFIMSVNSASARFMVRPLIFTFLGVAVSIYLFARARKNINILFFMPLVLLFWVNFHAEFMLGVIMVAIFWFYTIGVFLVRKIFKKKEVVSHTYIFKVSCIVALSLLALCINPHGIKLFLHPVSLTTSDLFMTRISEWLPPMHPIFRREVSIKFFYWTLGIGLLSFVLNFKKRDSLYLLFFIAFGLMSLSSIRFVPYLAMIAFPITAENLTRFAVSLRGTQRSVASPKGAPSKFAFGRVAIIAVIIWSIFLIERRTHYTEFGLGLAEKVCYPLQAGKFLKQAGINGNMFNSCDFGGYLTLYHPERPVFVDGRLDVYGEEVYKDLLDPDEETFKKYNINYLFLSFRHPATRGLLYRNKSWSLIYWDDITLVYLKRSEENMDLIDRFSYNYIHPLTGNYNFLETAEPEMKARVWKEIHRAIKLAPNSVRAHVVLGDIHVELKDYQKAIQAYEKAVEIGKKYNTTYMIKVYHNLGRLYHNFSEYTKAESYYSRVLKISRPGETSYNQALEDWGQLAYVQGKKQMAFKLIKKALKYKKRVKNSIFSGYPMTLAKLALLYEDFGEKDKAVSAWQEVYEIGGKDCRQQAHEHLEVLSPGGEG